MSKKAKKTPANSAPRDPESRLASPAKTATKRPASTLDDATAERIAIALEAIAGHLSAASPAAASP